MKFRIGLFSSALVFVSVAGAGTLNIQWQGDGATLGCTLASGSIVSTTGNINVTCAGNGADSGITAGTGGTGGTGGDTGGTGGDTGGTGGDTGGTGGDTGGTGGDPANALGQLENGNFVTADRAGIGTLYIPNMENPEIIVYDGGGAQIYYPGCAGMGNLGLAEIYSCYKDGSLRGGIIYSQRLPVGSTLDTTRVKLVSTETGDDLRSYVGAVTTTPGGMTSDQVACTSATPLANRTFYVGTDALTPSSWRCTMPRNTLHYVSFQAAGPNASRCGGSYTCRMMVGAW